MPTIWRKDMESGFRKKSDIFYDKKTKKKGVVPQTTPSFSLLNNTILHGEKS